MQVNIVSYPRAVALWHRIGAHIRAGQATRKSQTGNNYKMVAKMKFMFRGREGQLSKNDLPSATRVAYMPVAPLQRCTA